MTTINAKNVKRADNILETAKKLFYCPSCEELMETAVQSQCGHLLCQGCLRALSNCPECHVKIARRGQHERKDLQQLYNMFLNLYSAFKVEFNSSKSPVPLSRLLNFNGQQTAADEPVDPFDELLERLPQPSDPYRFLPSQSQTDSEYLPKRGKKASRTYGRRKRTEEKTIDYRSIMLKKRIPQIVNKVSSTFDSVFKRNSKNKRGGKKTAVVAHFSGSLPGLKSLPELSVFGGNQEDDSESNDLGKCQEKCKLKSVGIEENREKSDLTRFEENQAKFEILDFEQNREQDQAEFENNENLSKMINSEKSQQPQSEVMDFGNNDLIMEVEEKILSQQSNMSIELFGPGSQIEKNEMDGLEAQNQNLPLAALRDKIDDKDEIVMVAAIEKLGTPSDLIDVDSSATLHPIVPQKKSAVQFVELDVILDLRLRFAVPLPKCESQEDKDIAVQSTKGSQLSEIQIQSSQCSQIVLSSQSESEAGKNSNSNENNLVLPEQRLKIVLGIENLNDLGFVSTSGQELEGVDEPVKINSVRVKSKRVLPDTFTDAPPLPKKKLRSDTTLEPNSDNSEGHNKSKLDLENNVTSIPDTPDVLIIPNCEENPDARVHCVSLNGKPAKQTVPETDISLSDDKDKNRRMILTPNFNNSSPTKNVRDKEDNDKTIADVTAIATVKSVAPSDISTKSSLQNSSGSQNFVFCPTRLSREQLHKLRRVSEICGGKIVRNYSQEVTHLILNLESERVPQTMKYLFAIAGQKWVVVFDWVEECVKHNRIVSEEPYETSNFPQCDPGVRKSRLSKSPIFKNFNFNIAGNMKSTGTSTNDCMKLLILMGGNIISDENLDKEECVIIVGDPLDASVDYQNWFDTNGWLTISWEWILDCILTYTLVPFSQSHLLTNMDGKILLEAQIPPQLLKAQDL